MPKPLIPPRLADLLKRAKGKRARVVIEHILKHGQVTTEDLERYGYKHPPRAARDVREMGIPIETHRVTAADGRSIAAYRFGDLSQVRAGKLAGRRLLSKELKTELLAEQGGNCAVCLEEYEDRYLQVDHRVPYEVAGEPRKRAATAGSYMLLCGSCNRAKSWSCEHCANWLARKDPEVCKSCYWASPVSYKHIALRRVRRLDIVWTEEEVRSFEALEQLARSTRISTPKYVKAVLAKHCLGD